MALGRKYLRGIGFQGSKTINYQRKKEMKRKIWNEWTMNPHPHTFSTRSWLTHTNYDRAFTLTHAHHQTTAWWEVLARPNIT